MPVARRALLLFALCLGSVASHAALRLELPAQGLDASQRQATRALLDEALAALPPSFAERLDRPIQVTWEDDLPQDGYGRVTRPDALALNRRLLPALADGSAADTPSGRPHGTLRRELLATVLHELTHLYDRQHWAPAAERRLQQRCARQLQVNGEVGLPRRCRGESQRHFSLSDDPRLLDLAGWQQASGRRGAREADNGMRSRSPDDYELTDAEEFTAVNLEYFLLDPRYACRRPSLFAYFSAHFGWSPSHADCPTQLPYLDAGNDFQQDPLGKLDPERVYAVDYLFAEANDAWVSRWGHSMLRLVICAPGRPRGPDCRLDLDQHLVLSFRAFVDDLQLSSWGGLTGNYPSRLFILPLSQVIDEYTKVELRALSSIPLQLDRTQIDSLTRRAVELHWGYDGHYYFLSNNCAVETLKLLRGGTDQPALRSLDSIMPSGLLELLIAQHLADASVLDDPAEALRLGYRFDSFRDRYQQMFEVLRQRLPLPQRDVADWLALPAAERTPWIERADLRASAALLLLEQAAYRQQLLLAQDELKQRYLSGNPDERLDRVGKTLQQVIDNSGFLSSPAQLLDAGYGIPQPEEWEGLERNSQARFQTLRDLNDTLDGDLQQLLLPERREALETGKANVERIGQHLRALNQKAGGLKLH